MCRRGDEIRYLRMGIDFIKKKRIPRSLLALRSILAYQQIGNCQLKEEMCSFPLMCRRGDEIQYLREEIDFIVKFWAELRVT